MITMSLVAIYLYALTGHKVKECVSFNLSLILIILLLLFVVVVVVFMFVM